MTTSEPPAPFDVQIARRISGKEPRRLGSGTVVAPHLVLTARHVSKGCGNPDVDLCVRFSADGPTYEVIRVAWEDPDLDVALLETADLPAPPAHLEARDIYADERAELSGYPMVRKTNQEAGQTSNKDRKKVGATLRSALRLARILELDIDVDPAVWGGMSGAGVRVFGRAVAVVRALENGWSNKRLHATPIGPLLEKPDFREIMGYGPAYQKLDKDLQDLLSRVVQFLSQHSVIKGLIASVFKLTVKINTLVARELLQRPVQEVLNTLEEVLNTLEEDGESVFKHHRALSELTALLLPYAVDWRASLRRARSELDAGKTTLELTLCTETVAEIVLSGIHGRSCAFRRVEDDTPFSGVGLVRWPAKQLEEFVQSDQTCTEALMKEMQDQLLLSVGDAFKIQPTASMDAFRADVKARLRRAMNSRRKKLKQSYYLLVIDSDFEGDGAGQQAWELVQSAREGFLPQLQLVYLTGGLDQRLAEAEMALQISDLMETP